MTTFAPLANSKSPVVRFSGSSVSPISGGIRLFASKSPFARYGAPTAAVTVLNPFNIIPVKPLPGTGGSGGGTVGYPI